MVASFSPHRDAGGTLHLPSPTGIHHVTPSSAIKQLRRSLSRSPSKGSDFRLLTRPHSPAKNHYISSPLSPSRRASQGNLFLVPASSAPSPLAVPYPPSARINRPAIRRTGSFQPVRTRTTPSSPAKRVLTDSRDSGNTLPAPPVAEKTDEEKPSLQLSPTEITSSPELGSGENTPNLTVDNSFVQMPPSRIEKRRSGTFGPFSSTSSPLKRSDVIMNLDQNTRESPSAKRRSLHGASFGPDFNFFDGENGTGNMTDKQPKSNENDSPASPFVQTSASFPSMIPKRSCSLRKSTLQQRQSERSFFSRTRAGTENDADSPPSSPMVLRSRQRMSLDSQLFLPASRDGSSPQGIFSTSSAPLFTSSHTNNQQTQTPHAAHPLSRTITQSSSGSSLVDDSPTHEPIKFEKPRPVINFSKSLPTGSTRPIGPSQLCQENSNTSTESFATPENYKLVKPLPAAFMSTGLISKKNRNVDDVHNASITSKNMPDTPCKRPLNMLPGVHKPIPHGGVEKANSNCHSSGTPWTPFGNQQQQSTASPHPVPFPKGMGIFGSSYAKPPLSRRGSFVSVDGDEISQSQSPSGKHDIQLTIDSELPPTPTKQTFFPHGSHFSKSRPHRPSHSQTSSFDSLSGPSGPCCKLPLVDHSSPNMNEDSDSDMDDSPSAGLTHKFSQRPFPAVSSIPRSRLVQNLNSPSPHPRGSFPNLSPIKYSQFGNAKFSPTSTASPLGNKSIRRDSPHTPQEHILPPDPSGLSISAQGDQRANPQEFGSSALPATPTAPREYFAQVGKRPSLPLGGYNAPEVDPTLTARFEKVELVGTGEFSQVYRVTEPQSTTPFGSPFMHGSEQPSRSTTRAERVWAVKKSKQAYTGPKDRERRNNEVVALKALTNCDYIISYADSWESNNFLYIQTEFCEEGSLDVFLSQVGLKARLDDFRIWKILLELSLGLKHIHDSGFIHLDLKPANILITFEGVLKIADFGMASPWPAAAGIEGEGDREYIGPEVLMGRYDKPADIFALGLIMFETAGNVELPDNGVSWQKLRNGDISDVPSLTWSLESSNVLRDASGNPLPENCSFEQLCAASDSDEHPFAVDSRFDMQNGASDRLEPCQKQPSLHVRSGELDEPPDFMVDSTNDQALDTIVRWMISPDPADRPVADQIIQTYGVQWAERRRRAGATIYEGNWGPADEVLAEDAEMIDV
ncbi:WEE protein kinase [Helicocarpus griseus UAMH5409]|uniref:WEE protein kinase n=1 Tax=Helicocarpus griseus UAMH5409 TaxID=1447875 RepID=A0A2B7Y0T6_9EURO|nr:WEE protein kinase [Helicocarpus griseus UAMH5409]